MPIYMWDQNNSGGSFDRDDNLCPRVWIEADSEHEAEQRAFAMGVYYNGCEKGLDCPCCGDRWYSPDKLSLPVNLGEVTYETAEEYATKLATDYGNNDGKVEVRIFWKDGTVTEVLSLKR